MENEAQDKYEILKYDFRALIDKSFKQRKIKKLNYTFGAYAKFLGTDAASLRKILKGQRPLGVRLIQKWGLKLKLAPEEIENYCRAHQLRKKLKTLRSDKIKPKYIVLEENALATLSSWEGYAFLELMDLESFRPDLKWIADVLKIDLEKVHRLYSTFLEIGWLVIKADGSWVKSLQNTTTDAMDPKTATLRHLLMQNILSKAKQSLIDAPKNLRSIQAQTLIIDVQKIPEAVEKMRAFRQEMDHLLRRSGDRPQEVYEIVVGLYPLSWINASPINSNVI